MTPTNSSPANSSQANVKPVKKLGPIRTGLVSAIVLFFAVMGIYFTLFFDRNLKSLLEWIGTKANGAEVNIASIQTSFLKLSLGIDKVEVTNAQIPSQNLVEFDRLHFKMEIDALLRGKILINDASLLGLRFNNLRKKPGYVVPPEPKTPESTEPSPMMKAVTAQKDAFMKNEMQKSVLGDVVEVLQSDNLKDGLDAAMKELKSEQVVDSLLAQWPNKRKEWETKLAELKKQDKLKALFEEAKNIKPGKDPKEILEQVKQLKSLKEKANVEYKAYKGNFDALNNDVSGFKNQVTSLPDMIKNDIAAVKEKLKLPGLDAKKSGQEIFQRLVMQYMGPYVPYIEKARPYWEAKKDAKADRPKPKKRGEGINVLFPITKGYPTFWLQKMSLSSDAKGAGSYALLGELKNVTTHPKVIDKPIELSLKGDLTSQQISGINALVTVDMRDVFKFNAGVDVGSLMLKDFTLAQNEKLNLALESAKAKINLGAAFSKGEIDLKSKFDLMPEVWSVKTQKEKVTSSVQTILKSVGNFYVLASMKGAWNNSSMDVDTDFMDKFFDGIKAEIDRKVAEVKAQIEEQIKKRIGGKQAELASKLSSDQKDILGPLLAFDGSQANLNGGFDKMQEELEKKAKEKGKEKAKENFGKELDKLKSKVKLPF